MGTEGPNVPLLVSSKDDHDKFTYIKKPSFLLKSTKWVLKFAMLLIFISWASFLFFAPLDSVNKVYTKVVYATNETFFGITGSIFLIYSGPVLVIAFLAIIYLRISGKEEIQEFFSRRQEHVFLNSKHTRKLGAVEEEGGGGGVAVEEEVRWRRRIVEEEDCRGGGAVEEEDGGGGGVVVRIEKTKRSKNDQKQTRNGKKTKSKEQDKESSRISPTQSNSVKERNKESQRSKVKSKGHC
ncbi:hypothetical protein Tco_0834026 [Tanacetum coccineum]